MGSALRAADIASHRTKLNFRNALERRQQGRIRKIAWKQAYGDDREDCGLFFHLPPRRLGPFPKINLPYPPLPPVTVILLALADCSARDSDRDLLQAHTAPEYLMPTKLPSHPNLAKVERANCLCDVGLRRANVDEHARLRIATERVGQNVCQLAVAVRHVLLARGEGLEHQPERCQALVDGRSLCQTLACTAPRTRKKNDTKKNEKKKDGPKSSRGYAISSLPCPVRLPVA